MVGARRVAVVGAGLAGAAAARALHDAGVPVQVFDKSRGVGGRLATRRADGFAFDHGAQYFTARDPAFAALVERWVEAGIAAPWAEPGWFVGRPAMGAPAKALLEGLPVSAGCAVARLVRHEAGWRLHDGEDQPMAEDLAFEAVLLSCPAPQSAALLAGTGTAWPELGAVRFAPCWALLLAYDGPPPFEQPYRRTDDPEAAIAWIARDGTKPDRSAAMQTLVVHASPEWSRQHLELEPAEVVRLLRKELSRLFGTVAEEAVRHVAAHRWRYSLVEHPVGQSSLWSPELGLGVCGDGCIGGRVEAAYLSGISLAACVKKSWLA